MKTKILSIGILIASLLLTGCSDYLDLTPTDKSSSKTIWSKPEYGKLALNNFYHYIRIYGAFDDDGSGQSRIGLTEGATETLKYGSLTRMPHMGFANELAFGQITSDAQSAATYLGGWANFYNRIIKVNEVFSDFRKYASFDEETSNRFEAEIRFFRGYLYYELIKRHKNVILYNEDLEAITNNKALNTEAEGWQMVYDDLSFAAQYLPEEWTGEDNGRVTRGAASAMLSRAMMYAERWEDAKEAAYKVISSGKYGLNPDFKSAYSRIYREGNREAILEFSYRSTGPSHNFDDIFSPKGDPGVVQGGMGTPTQEMVESFEKADGSGFPDWSPWRVAGGTTETPPYAQLEPRFHATVLYNQADWKGRKIEPFIGGIDGWASYRDDPNPQGRTTTGYYLRKLVDETHDFTVRMRSVQPWIAIRYAEVLLNYAEACFRTGDNAQANWAVKEIRDRVGLSYSDRSGEALMAAIRQERKVELAYEGHLYWDMRRWKLAHIAYTGTRVHGFRIEQEGVNFRYTYVDCDKQDRFYPERLYRIPLPLNELENNLYVEQFPEWR
jgi:hypothetical protein